MVYKSKEQWHWFDCPRQLGTNSPDTPTKDAALDLVELREGDIFMCCEPLYIFQIGFNGKNRKIGMKLIREDWEGAKELPCSIEPARVAQCCGKPCKCCTVRQIRTVSMTISSAMMSMITQFSAVAKFSINLGR